MKTQDVISLIEYAMHVCEAISLECHKYISRGILLMFRVQATFKTLQTIVNGGIGHSRWVVEMA